MSAITADVVVAGAGHNSLITAAYLAAAGREVVVVVGPEGGIAPDELADFVAVGATPVRLGRPVLRTSTAGAAALAVLSARLGSWS